MQTSPGGEARSSGAPDGETRAPAAPGWRGFLGAALAAATTGVVASTAARHLRIGPVDDAFISLRYATNWARGLGLSFNPGETVEGYTNFLWVALEAAAIRLGADPVLAMKALGWLSLAGLAFVLALFLEQFVLRGRTALAAVGASVIALHPTLVCWAAAGMESCLHATLVLLSLLIALRATGAAHAAVAGSVLALAALTRPEAVVLAPILALVVWRSRQAPRDASWAFAAFAVVYGVYFAARWAHFGFFLPNTFYAKFDYGSIALLQRGGIYVWEFVRASPAIVALAAIGAVMARRAPTWVQAVSVMAGLQTLAVIWEGGDHFAMFRFLAPVIPFLGLLALYPIVRLSEHWRRSPRPPAALVLAGLLVVALSNVQVSRQIRRDASLEMTQLERFQLEDELTRGWRAIGIWLARTAPEGSSVLTIAIGAIGYYSEMTVIDPHGLVDPVIAHHKMEIGAGTAGHEKFDIDYVLDKRPDYLLIANRLTPWPLLPLELPDNVWGEFNRAVLESPRLSRLYWYRPVEIVPGSFVNIHVRKKRAEPS